MKSWKTGEPPKMLRSERPWALMMPTVTEPRSMPSGLPIAIAQSPTRILSESPSDSVGRLVPSILITATSVSGSAPDHARLEVAAIVERHRDVVGVTHHVVVGQDVPVAVDDETRARAGLGLLAARCFLAEEPPEQLVLRSSLEPDFLRTSMKTTAGNVCSTTLTNGLSAPAIAGAEVDGALVAF